jgi:hypothetical protein
MADEKAPSGKGKANPDKKQTAKKTGRSKKATAKKPSAKKGAAKKTSPKSGPKKATAKKRPAVGFDKSIAQFRDSLEHSVTLSRERIQEVVDDAVKRGRMTHGDAEKMIGELLKRGRKQTDALLSELEKLVRQARRKLP